MLMKFAPIILVILSSLCYHISQKSTPTGLNPMIALIVTYVIATVVSIISYFIFVPKSNITSLFDSIAIINWSSILLGFAVVGLELGFLLAYRAGWKISSVSLFSSTMVALVLIPTGVFIFKELISANILIGVVLCIFGLVLITK